MKIFKVTSSAVLKIGYDNNNLFVEFIGGKWYKYANIPEKVFEQFLESPSKGYFVNEFIKPVYLEVPLTNQEQEMVRRTSPQ